MNKDDFKIIDVDEPIEKFCKQEDGIYAIYVGKGRKNVKPFEYVSIGRKKKYRDNWVVVKEKVEKEILILIEYSIGLIFAFCKNGDTELVIAKDTIPADPKIPLGPTSPAVSVITSVPAPRVTGGTRIGTRTTNFAGNQFTLSSVTIGDLEDYISRKMTDKFLKQEHYD